jgi:hypothetical protein
MRSRNLALLLMAASLLAAGRLSLSSPDQGTQPPAPPLQWREASPVTRSPAQAAVQAEGLKEQLVSASSRAVPAREPAWLQGFVSRDPYPLVQALLAQRVPGSYAAAHSIYLACLEAMLVTDRRLERPLEETVNDPEYGERLKAKTEIQARCTRLMTDLIDPLPDDVNGHQYVAAIRLLGVYGLSSKSERRAAVEVLARQGQLMLADGEPPLGPKNWRGEVWQHEQGDFHAARRIARWRASSSPEMASSDIRLLLRCYVSGRCDYRYDSELDAMPEERRRRVQALASDMEAVFRSGESRAFFEK